MKRNAIVRIIIWSICLVLLSSMLLGGLAFRSLGFRRTDAVLLTEPVATNPPREYVYTRSAVDEVNVRTAPNTEATIIGMLQPGEIVTVENEIIVNEISWSHISSPMDGWVQTQYISAETLVAPNVIAENADSLAFDADKVHSLDIEWVAGHIQILPAETDEILISEDAVSSKRDAMAWKLREGQLSIDFCEDDDRFFGFGIGDHTILEKDLTIYVPMDWECRSLEIDAAAASVEMEGLTIREVEFDGAHGACELRSCSVERMDIDTASGDIRFSGRLGTLECDAASADILAVMENIPSRIDVDTMSGDLDITLPADAGFSLKLDTMSETFDSEFTDITVRNGEYIRGDGSCRINVSAMSGDVMIRKGTTPAK